MATQSSAATNDGPPLAAEELAPLRRFTSPTVANALETFGVSPKEATYTNDRIRCIFPDLGAMVGYACTARIMSAQPPVHPRRVARTDYWEYTRKSPAPRVTVVQDLSVPSGGAYWGEVNAGIHRALGSIGVITNGSVRDLEEVRALAFHFFASGVHVSHGYAHLEDFDVPVVVFGMLVRPGDIIHADRHGAVVIPRKLAPQVIEAAKEIERQERPIIGLCKSLDFSIAELDQLVSPAY